MLSPTIRASQPRTRVDIGAANASTTGDKQMNMYPTLRADVTPEGVMRHFLHTQEATLQRLLDARTQPAGLSQLASTPDGSSTRRANFPSAVSSPMTATHAADGAQHGGDALDTPSEQPGASQHRADIIAELLRCDKESQWAAMVTRNVRQEQEKLKRAADLEEARLALVQKKNEALRARLSALTHERREAAQRSTAPQQVSTALVLASTDSTSQLALMGGPVSSADYTNEIVEARRRLDQRTRELHEVQDRLRQLQEYHLAQLSGQLQPSSFAEDALRTTENFLDTETNMAVRATVVDSLLEVNQALKPLAAGSDSDFKSGAALPCLESINTLWDRLAVQNFVVGRINRLFTCMCPTAPPLTLLKDTNMM